MDTLEHTILVIWKELTKNLVFLQKKIGVGVMNNVLAVLTAVVDAASLSSAQKQKLVALVQSKQASELSALAAATCVRLSSDIVDVLNDLMDKAQAQLDETRHAEPSAAHNFALLQQSLEDQSTEKNVPQSLRAVVASQFANKKTGFNIRSAKRFITGCNDKAPSGAHREADR